MTGNEAAKLATEVVSSMKTQPALIALLALNAIGIAAAVWFLSNLLKASEARMALILKACLPGGT